MNTYTRSASAFLIGAASGAAAAYLFDPDRGAYRRAVMADGVASKSRKLQRMTQSAWRDLRNRVEALPHRMTSHLKGGEEADELRLIERVRAKMGRYVSHPAAIQVGAYEGVIILSGPILQSEYEDLLLAIHAVPGVQEVKNYLVAHDSVEGIPALQGESVRSGERWEFLKENWSPGFRLAVAAGSGVLALYGLRSGGVSGGFATGTSAALLTRCAINRPLHRLPTDTVQGAKRALSERAARKTQAKAFVGAL